MYTHACTTRCHQFDEQCPLNIFFKFKIMNKLINFCFFCFFSKKGDGGSSLSCSFGGDSKFYQLGVVSFGGLIQCFYIFFCIFFLSFLAYFFLFFFIISCIFFRLVFIIFFIFSSSFSIQFSIFIFLYMKFSFINLL